MCRNFTLSGVPWSNIFLLFSPTPPCHVLFEVGSFISSAVFILIDIEQWLENANLDWRLTDTDFWI